MMRRVQIVKISLKTAVLAGTVAGVYAPDKGTNDPDSPAMTKLASQVETIMRQDPIDGILMGCSSDGVLIDVGQDGQPSSSSMDDSNAC